MSPQPQPATPSHTAVDAFIERWSDKRRLRHSGWPGPGQAGDFHRNLCEIEVLDLACGSANFLYVTLEHILEALTELGIVKQYDDEQLELDDR